MTRFAGCVLALLCLGFRAGFAQTPAEEKLPAPIQVLRDYIENEDFPEVFGDTKYEIRFSKFAIADLDGDGTPEVLISTRPHYRQSPTITIYQLLLKEKKVRRLIEGLAPGKLVPVSGSYLDSHVGGFALDMFQGEVPPTPNAFEEGNWGGDMVTAAVRQKMRVALYKTFAHLDGAKGTGTFLDMTHLPSYSAAQNCGAFEFSEVTDMMTGAIEGQQEQEFLAALAGGELYVYRIYKISGPGFLQKRIWVVKPPQKVKALRKDLRDRVGYVSPDDRFHLISLPK